MQVFSDLDVHQEEPQHAVDAGEDPDPGDDPFGPRHGAHGLSLDGMADSDVPERTQSSSELFLSPLCEKTPSPFRHRKLKISRAQVILRISVILSAPAALRAGASDLFSFYIFHRRSENTRRTQLGFKTRGGFFCFKQVKELKPASDKKQHPPVQTGIYCEILIHEICFSTFNQTG